jgi:hypothetical protein
MSNRRRVISWGLSHMYIYVGDEKKVHVYDPSVRPS